MLASQQIEELICVVSSMDKETLIEQFHQCPSRFPIDFTPEFFEDASVERLRHIFVAVCLQCQYIPHLAAEALAA